jgi:hypothetical protein
VTRDRAARQWRFLAASLETLFGGPSDVFGSLPAAEAAQLKFPVQRRLREHYSRHAGRPVLELMLVHERELPLYRVPGAEHYPRLAGYCLLVRDGVTDLTLPEDGTDRIREYLERVATEAARAELQAYQALPKLSLAPLERWFRPQDPAWREIEDRVHRRLRDGWVLSNPLNPSTVRTLDVKVRGLQDDEARVVARESWYLLWWSRRTRSYLYSFRQSVRHAYLLRREGAGWRVSERTAQRPRPL